MILAIIGVNISSTLNNWQEVLIFWLMYLTTIISFIVVGMSLLFYYILKDKKGKPGPKGERGDKGEIGDAGSCEVGCRNQICTKTILDSIKKEINELADNQTPSIELKNLYIKEKVKQMCNSDEFQQLAPFKGPNSLIEYMKDKWLLWIKLIYNSAGRAYFETIGAENEFEWHQTDSESDTNPNPFNEIKKYDLFYWGLGPHYRPTIVNRCVRKSNIEESLSPNGQNGHPNVKLDNTVEGDGWRYPDDNKKNLPRTESVKYSMISYINLVPEAMIKHKYTNNVMKIKFVSNEIPNLYTVRKLNPQSNDYDYCISIDNNNTITDNNSCNSDNKNQQFLIEFTGNGTKEIRLKHKTKNKYLKQQSMQKNSSSTIDSLITDPKSEKRKNNNKDYTIFILQI